MGQRPQLRRLFDPRDFVQMVWESFLGKSIHEVLFETPKKLRAYLAKMAANMVAVAERDYLKRQKRNLLQQQSLESSTLHAEEKFVGHEVSPEQSAILHEELGRLTRNATDQEQQILTLLALGMTYKEIASDQGISEKTVQRIIARFRREFGEGKDSNN